MEAAGEAVLVEGELVEGIDLGGARLEVEDGLFDFVAPVQAPLHSSHAEGEVLLDSAFGFEVGDVLVAEFLVGFGVLGREKRVLRRKTVTCSVQTRALFAFSGARAGGLLRICAIRLDLGCRRRGHFLILLEDYGRGASGWDWGGGVRD